MINVKRRVFLSFVLITVIIGVIGLYIGIDKILLALESLLVNHLPLIGYIAVFTIRNHH